MNHLFIYIRKIKNHRVESDHRLHAGAKAPLAHIALSQFGCVSRNPSTGFALTAYLLMATGQFLIVPFALFVSWCFLCLVRWPCLPQRRRDFFATPKSTPPACGSSTYGTNRRIIRHSPRSLPQMANNSEPN